MVELKIHAEGVDGETLKQIYQMRDHPAANGLIAMMPDCHAGAGCTVGTTMEIGDKIVPNWIGVDIGCGVYGFKFEDVEIDFEQFDEDLRAAVPLGMKRREKPVMPEWAVKLDYKRIVEQIGYDNNIMTQVGTLGGGNHFIEIGQGKDCKWCFIHTGSRHFGLSIAKFYQNEAKIYCEANDIHVPKDTEYLPMDEGGDKYLDAMRVGQQFAHINRWYIASKIQQILPVKHQPMEVIDTVHNYIGNDNICRKGAISAYFGERLLIPLNMRDGTIIGTGKGNLDYNMSAPHGAGRGLGSRGAVKRMLRDGILTMEQFEKEMEGIYSTSVKPSTIDESPFAYKPFSQIEEYVKETVTIDEIVKPIYNLKDG